MNQGALTKDHPLPIAPHLNLTESVCKVVLQKSIPTQVRQLILYIRDKLMDFCKGQVDGFLGESLLQKACKNTSCELDFAPLGANERGRVLRR